MGITPKNYHYVARARRTGRRHRQGARCMPSCLRFLSTK